jgi:hypothetical protein
MNIFTRTAGAALLVTVASAAGAQGYKPPLVGLKPPVVGTQPVLPSNPALGAGFVSSRAEAQAIVAAARAQAEAAREAARAARGGR